MIDALVKTMNFDFDFPINLGSDYEVSLNQLTQILFDKFGKNKINYTKSNADDPKVRKPDITRAKDILNWTPKVSISTGIDNTYNYLKNHTKIN